MHAIVQLLTVQEAVPEAKRGKPNYSNPSYLTTTTLSDMPWAWVAF